MSELISGKEALIALANGRDVLCIGKDYESKPDDSWIDAKEVEVGIFLNDAWSFKLKPRTITLNGVEVEEIHSSEWNKNNPKKVILEFKNEDAARFFQSKALEIFNDMK